MEASPIRPTYFVKPEQLAGLYMLTAQKTRVDCSELTKYSFYLKQRFEQEQKDASFIPLVSNVYFREAARDKGDIFDFQEDCVKTQQYVDDNVINKEIISWMSFSLLHPCLRYSKDYFEKEKSKRCEKDGKDF